MKSISVQQGLHEQPSDICAPKQGYYPEKAAPKPIQQHANRMEMHYQFTYTQASRSAAAKRFCC